MSKDDQTGALGDLLRKREQEAKAKETEKEKRKVEKEKKSDMYAGLPDSKEEERDAGELDLNGDSRVADPLGNLVPGRVVHDLLATGSFKSLLGYKKPVVCEEGADWPAAAKPQTVVRNVTKNALRLGGGVGGETFEALGQFMPAAGYGFVRLAPDTQKITVVALRKVTLYLCFRGKADEAVGSYDVG